MLHARFFRLPNDVRYGFTQVRRNPGLAAIVILSLALGIGANTAIFSVVHAVMLRELPVPEPDSLLAFQYTQPPGEWHAAIDHTHSGRASRDAEGRPVSLSISWPAFSYLRSGARLSTVAGFVPLGMVDKPAALVNGQPTLVDAEMVTADYFPTIGLAPILGRGIVPSDEQPAAPRVAVISYAFWNRAFAASRTAIGSTLIVNTVPVTIVGVAPAGFTGLEVGRTPDLWLQMGPQAGLTPWGWVPDGEPQTVFGAANYWWLQVVVRPRAGATTEQARAELDRLFRESLLATAASPVPSAKLPTVALTPAARAFNNISRRLSTPLSVLAAVVGLVLLVACANVATLLLARANARRKEMAVKLALGAPRWRLVRQLLAESFVYAAAGAALGVLLAAWGSRSLFVLLTTTGRDRVAVDVRLDPAVLAFTAVAALVTTVLFGLAPALRATHLDLASDLKEQRASSGSERGRGRLRGGKALVVAQIAMSLPLVLGAGLFLRTLDKLGHETLGFDPEKVLLFRLDPTKAGIKDARLIATYADVQERLSAIPGVRSVTAARLGLMTGWISNGPISWEDEPANIDRRARVVHYNMVAPGFFDTMGMGLVLGRVLDARDVADGPKVAVINETMARKLFAGRNPIGRRFWFGRTREGKATEIVGVVRDAKYASLRAPAPPTTYLPYTQSHIPLAAMVFQVRAAGDPMALVQSVTRAVAEVAPGVPVDQVKTQADQIAESLGPERMYASLFTFFGAVALLLACVGLYGTMSYALGRRTREIGIRMALGAAAGRVLRGSLSDALVMGIAGVALGGLLAWAGARYVRSLLFDVTPFDVPTLVGATAVMVTVALAAGYIPARRASRLDPLRALREE